MTWTTATRSSENDFGSLQKLAGHEILSLYRKNYTIKVFEKLHGRENGASMSKKKWLGMKMDLYEDYDHPKPFPADKHLRLSKKPPTLGYLMLGQKGTGILNVNKVVKKLEC